MSQKRPTFEYTKTELKAFVDALARIGQDIHVLQPDAIIAPMNGANPFIDVLAIIDSRFDPSQVDYLPSSSRIHQSPEVISHWYSNYLQAHPTVRKTCFLDEVVSGSSVVKLHTSTALVRHQVDQARLSRDITTLVQKLSENPTEGITDLDAYTMSRHSAELQHLLHRIPKSAEERERFLSSAESKRMFEEVTGYIQEAFGKSTSIIYTLEDETHTLTGKTRWPKYGELKGRGRVVGYPVPRIITMDQPELTPVQFEEVQSFRGYNNCLPSVARFEYTPAYVGFLSDVAGYVGKNPDTVNPVNTNRIMNCTQYINLAFMDALKERMISAR
jgi:hypothetical protein